MLKFDQYCCVVVVNGVRGCESNGSCDSCMDLHEYLEEYVEDSPAQNDDEAMGRLLEDMRVWGEPCPFVAEVIR